jgi:tetratricopeptide (TPR) repeat protein
MDEQSAALLYGLGRAEASLALLDQAAAHLSQAFDYYAQAADMPRCIAVASVAVFSHEEAWGMAPVVERALRLVPPDSVDAGWLLCLRGSYLASKGDYEAGKALLQRAVAIAEGANDHRLELRALYIWEYAAAVNLRLRDFEEASARALDLLSSVDSPRDEAGVRGAAAFLLTWIKGEVREATAQTKAALAAAERLRDRRILEAVVSFGHQTAKYAGNWAEARALSERVLAVGQVSSRMLAHTLLLECQLGNFEQAESYLQRLLANAEPVRDTLAPSEGEPDLLTAEAARIMGSRRGLASVREFGRRSVASMPIQSILSSQLRIALGLVAAEEQDAAQAAEEYGYLDELIGSGFAKVYSRQLGIIANAAGLDDKAVAHFEDALAFTRKAGYRPELAWTCCDYADLLRQRNGSGDGERAAALLEEGLVIARDLGMRPLMERILARRQFLKA